MMISRFKSNLRFALHKEPSKSREEVPLNRIEKIGDKLSWFAYDFKEFCSTTFFDPRVVTVFLTAFVMVFISLLFYQSITWSILSRIYDSVLYYINWDYVRFTLWLLSEITIFGIGVRAFGRFSNQKLLEYYYNNQNMVA